MDMVNVYHYRIHVHDVEWTGTEKIWTKSLDKAGSSQTSHDLNT